MIPALITWTVAAPAVAFVLLVLPWGVGRSASEVYTARVVRWAFLSSFLAAAAALVEMLLTGVDAVVVPLGHLFSVHHHDLALTLLVDRLSLPFALLVTALCGVIGSFGYRYLHREPGYTRFFILLLLFSLGMLAVVLGGNLGLLYAGWELLGLSSALLIGFFHERAAPVKSALRAFITYRICDVALLTAAIFLHQASGSGAFDEAYLGLWPHQTSTLSPGAAGLIGLLLVVAALGKSGQLPFSGWLPRAMEGPTPSSAIFYGALSIHAGAYLLLRNAPVLDAAPAAQVLLVGVGLSTALHATLAGRAQTDVKSQLAYASMAQVGLILAEIGLGLRFLALLHVVGHATLRSLQLLQAPSALADHHQQETGAGGLLAETGRHYEALLPAGARRWLYRFAMERSYLDDALERFLLGPVVRGLEAADRAERRWISRLGRGPGEGRGDEAEP